MSFSTLSEFLSVFERERDGLNAAAAATVRSLVAAALKIHREIAFAPRDDLATKGDTNVDGDVQRTLDILSDNLFLEAARSAPVAIYASEEQEAPVPLNDGVPLALAIDPLDGSSNIDANISIGTIFSILPVIGGREAEASILQPGNRQIASGFFIYGPQFVLVLTMGRGTHGFVFSQATQDFLLVHESLKIAPGAKEFAINASNYRHWSDPVRSYVDDCLQGADGPRGKDFNMRWIASLVAETWRILVRGGVFLYPGDKRANYAKGRLRLVYEANPIALLIEQAGGTATDTVTRILDIEPEHLHQRVPLVFGCADEVTRIARHHTEFGGIADRSPLFGNRGLFRT
ncbi:hypothetical protein N182_34855 [Sinorhizobium sp. GL2]|nr:hypothetical protein N182_34855 [Sinorhizobium sp. GL2]